MIFRYYSNTVSQASRAMAKGIFVVGLLLIGFGALIVAMPEIFALLVAGIFVFFGIGCLMTAIKIYWAQRPSHTGRSDDPFRENVRVRESRIFEDGL